MRKSYLKRKYVDTLTYSHQCVKPDAKPEPYHEDAWELSYIITGSGTRLFGKTEETFHSGEVTLAQPGMKHLWSFDKNDVNQDGNVEFITISFDANLIRNLAPFVPEYKELAAWYEDLGVAIKLSDDGAETIKPQILAMENEILEHRVGSLLCILADIRHSDNITPVGTLHVSNQAERVQKIEAWLRCNFQQKISLEQLANYIGMNRSSLCTYYKNQTGNTIFSFLMDLRVKMAKHLLDAGNLSVSACGYSSGFNDMAYFCRAFKASIGISPMQYKKQVAGS